LKKSIPIIVQFVSSLKVCNKKGFRYAKENRECSVIIIVLKGKIRFTSNGQTVIAAPDAPVYIPSGTTYLNECIENAESLLFNFKETKHRHTILSLSHIEQQTALRIFERISILKSQNSASAVAEVLSLLYDIVRNGYAESVSRERMLIKPALAYIELHFCDPDITVSQLADLCCVSAVYLNRLFKKELMETPFSYITRRRMETARDMLREHCSVSEIVHFVGYADIYQFSRAFKKYYGVSPKHYESMNFGMEKL